METNVFIVNRDGAIRQQIKNLLHSGEVGIVVGESVGGEEAMNKLLLLKPDLLIGDDLFLAQNDFQFLGQLKRSNPQMLFIMVTSNITRDVQIRAYENGIEYFLYKPIVTQEVMIIVKKVIEKLKLLRSLRHIESAFKILKEIDGIKLVEEKNEQNIRERTKVMLSQMGILSEAGSKDIIEILEILVNGLQHGGEVMPRYKTSYLYWLLNNRYKEKYKLEDSSEAAIEQRVRRAITKALRNIANMGLEDYGDYSFITYANTLFDFKEVRMEMDYIKGKNKYRGKINVKKFLEGLLLFVHQEL